MGQVTRLTEELINTISLVDASADLGSPISNMGCALLTHKGLKALGGRGSVLEEPGLELPSEGEVFGYGAKVTGQGVPGLRCQKREGFSSGGGFADAGNGCQGLTGGAQSARRSVEGDAGVDEFGSEVVEGFVCVGEESEGDPLVDREPMEFYQVSGDVVVARYVQDESTAATLYRLS
ncbi:hypothetical protein NDU88_010464 [Pleurodeles waltl]|uniref:Uncharacterized protein n=1 Tax=Pleurodeles waltl TaxID=8319 RepID=A0AAV7RZQ7_PLEWA|nr:hypothetical protein NDU88_010464 [Pleurodeles waltl]